jgi:ribulose-phosphate 3-epimerase
MAAKLQGIAPSILAADFGRLREQVQTVLDAGAKVIHVDVMDGHFVPPLTMGPAHVEALAPTVHAADAHIDVHLMVERPERHVEAFAKAGADNITVHAEATPQVHYAVHAIREAGCTAGVAICPGTPVEALAEVREELWLALCMTVDPGWGGQRLIPWTVEKARRVRALVGEGVEVEVDGGIDAATAARCAEAGASLFVAGAAIFGAADPAAAYGEIAAAAGCG